MGISVGWILQDENFATIDSNIATFDEHSEFTYRIDAQFNQAYLAYAAEHGQAIRLFLRFRKISNVEASNE